LSIASILFAVPSVPAHADYATDTCDEYEQWALKGNANAQVEIANCYIIGYGRTADYQVAEDWLIKAIEAGSEKAPVTLAALILFKSEDEPRFGLAVTYLQDNIPSINGLPEFSLAAVYRNGLGVPANSQRSNRYLLQSAELGHMMARFAVFGQYVLGERNSEDTRGQRYWRNEFLTTLESRQRESLEDFKKKIVNDELVTTYLFGEREIEPIISEL
jgi:TPR repeat protein